VCGFYNELKNILNELILSCSQHFFSSSNSWGIIVTKKENCTPITNALHYFEQIYTAKQSHPRKQPDAKGESLFPWPCQQDRETRIYNSFQTHQFLWIHELDSWAQKASGSGQNKEMSWISRLAMCQSTKRACTDLNSTRIVDNSHHLLSSLSANMTKAFSDTW